MTNPATEPVVVVEDLTFQYRRGTEPALRGVSLEVAPGEVLLVAGPSGCGKSTLIRALNGLIPHSYGGELSGSVRVGGLATQASSLKGLATMVGTVLQEPTRQLVASTVRAELTFGPENLGVERDEIGRRLVSVSSASGLDPLLGRTTDELSGGEAQQIAIGGALMLHPRLLVLDEPLANLDPASASRLLGLVRHLADEGTAVVLVEHRIEDVLEARPDRALYLEDGRVTYLGSMAGFLETADPTLVKLPFEAWLRRARAGAAPSVQPDQRPEASPNGEQPPRIEWNGVDAAYDGRTVLHDVSARLGSHERVAVLGPNGSGKTTLFKAALGLRPLSAGEVLVDGTSIAGRGVAELATTFGYVFQNPSQMLFAATVRDEILFGPRNLLRNPDGFDDLVDRSLVRVGLADEPGVAERPPRTLSHGQQKRLAIGVALALEPRTLVLDEPSAGQDYRSATAFMREVERIAGLESIYFVTHDVDLALTTADRVILLKEGRIAADGTPHQVVQDRERWRACNLRETSLMEANRQADIRGSRFLGPEALAAQLVHASS
ncbi:MAG TPA: ATP-binding cassette domain-containing protein [Candidatus Limnocylindria bacterium]|jgi:energy-coupling factor transport system ATP-binding protein